LAKIAIALEEALTRRHEQGTRGDMRARTIARDDGWSVADVVCTSGPDDRPFEEQHSGYAIAVVLAGSFQYRASFASGLDSELMAPGSLMLGNAGQYFECGHEHGEGDRCVSFWYAPDYFERLAADVGVRRSVAFRGGRVPPLRVLAPQVARAAVGATGSSETEWEELSLKLAAHALVLAGGASPDASDSMPNAEARVTRAVRTIDRDPGLALTLDTLAQEAGLSRYHFLRTFERVTGVTPHQYVLRARLREAAIRLVAAPDTVIDIALDAGFGDVSNFNRAFRAEFGVSPSKYRSTTHAHSKV
jgi:AraC family transcriptional regulator